MLEVATGWLEWVKLRLLDVVEVVVVLPGTGSTSRCVVVVDVLKEVLVVVVE